ncbi:hypothetical protein LGV61_02425 [Desulfurispirillum indicum]|uniref:S24 family peptidase n=1 Tax=Desulfurispirillum indicum TaxID=936456 RepID=UPI001CF9C813|nr:S24 family peptidase [Desulfurispirillum indicum]UCZ57152.1 hypothetical protein LGV61_02425 [Desulfurispirillum indicum]
MNANINWLLTGSGDMFLEGHAGSLPSGSAPVRTTEYDFVSVTPYRAWESQSHGACVWQMDAHSILWLYRPWIECHLRISKEVVWSLCMQGDNMDPTLRAGDILLVDGSCKEVAIEGIYLICCDGMHAVRRVQRMGSTLTLSNDNSAYRDTDLDVSRKGLEIIGRVVARLAAL